MAGITRLNGSTQAGAFYGYQPRWFEVADTIIRHKFVIGRDLNSILRDGSRIHTHTTSIASLLGRNPERELNPFQGKGHKPLQTNGRCQRFYGGEPLNQPS